eukprot:CAMPEP_0184698246 /NCGR_PEP_ID=MMETSP0313-20130426/4939_1 /TAXON_ID=2792 /ORGANISM="Porphyridium aerugineum, Strain SAG 1380-2" /LENGTH=325 /DNA_ID=CAMNT_0027157163 /DNA_START=38 /DNA_END=1015 /DNA_ORIENTATION=+
MNSIPAFQFHLVAHFISTSSTSSSSPTSSILDSTNPTRSRSTTRVCTRSLMMVRMSAYPKRNKTDAQSRVERNEDVDGIFQVVPKRIGRKVVRPIPAPAPKIKVSNTNHKGAGRKFVEEEEEEVFLNEFNDEDLDALIEESSGDDGFSELDDLVDDSSNSAMNVMVFSKEDDEEVQKLAMEAAVAGDERKAKDITCLRVSHLTVITSFFVFMSASSPPQLRAIVNNIQGTMVQKHKLPVRRLSGTAESGWMLLDYGDIMVHVMDKDQRQFYDLESRWAAGIKVDLSQHLVPNTAKVGAGAGAGVSASDAASSDKESVSPLDEDWL